VLFNDTLDCFGCIVSVMDEWMSIENRRNYAKRGQSKYSKKTVSQSQLFPHKSHPDYSGIELAPLRQEAGKYLPESSYSVATDWSDSRLDRGTYLVQCD
jgi:hypothetical protein